MAGGETIKPSEAYPSISSIYANTPPEDIPWADDIVRARIRELNNSIVGEGVKETFTGEDDRAFYGKYVYFGMGFLEELAKAKSNPPGSLQNS